MWEWFGYFSILWHHILQSLHQQLIWHQSCSHQHPTQSLKITSATLQWFMMRQWSNRNEHAKRKWVGFGRRDIHYSIHSSKSSNLMRCNSYHSFKMKTASTFRSASFLYVFIPVCWIHNMEHGHTEDDRCPPDQIFNEPQWCPQQQINVAEIVVLNSAPSTRLFWGVGNWYAWIMRNKHKSNEDLFIFDIQLLDYD